MNLASKLKSIRDLSEEVSADTRKQAMREVFEHHLKLAEASGYCPILEKVIRGETTFLDEYKWHGQSLLLEPGLLQIFSGNCFMEEEANIVDEAIRDIYY